MRLAGVKLTLTGAEGSSPPLASIEVEDAEGLALVASCGKLIEVVEPATAAHPLDAPQADPPTEAPPVETAPVVTEEAPVEAPATEEAQTETAPVDTASEAAPAEETPAVDETAPTEPAPAEEEAPVSEVDEATRRAADITNAFDLLEPDAFVKTGDRAGLPKVDAVAEIVGFAVTAAEIDAAWAAKEAAA